MKRVAATLILVELVLGACSAPALQSPLPTSPPDVRLRVESVVTPSPPTPAYYYVAGDGSYVPITPMPTQPSLRPTSSVSAYPIDLNNLPATTHDLLFLSGATLYVWSHDTRKIEPIVGLAAGDTPNAAVSIQGYTLLRDGTLAAVFYTDQKQALHIGAFDLKNRTLLPLQELAKVDPVIFETQWLQISPDGAQIAFIRWGDARAAPATIGEARVYESMYGSIHVMPADGSSAPREIGMCALVLFKNDMRTCRGLLWSRDGNALAWVDGIGLWMVEATNGDARLIVKNSDNLDARLGPVRVVSRLIDWSPDNRFILYQTGFYEGGVQTIVDATTGAWIDLAGTSRYSHLGANAHWLRDGRVLLMGPDYTTREPAYAEPVNGIWAIEALPAISMTRMLPIALNLLPNNVPVSPIELDTGEIRFAVLNADLADDRSRGVYSLDAGTGAIRKLSDLPATTFKNALRAPDDQPITNDVFLAWSPDGETLIYDDAERLMMVRAMDMPLYDLRPLGQSGPAGQFAWLP